MMSPLLRSLTATARAALVALPMIAAGTLPAFAQQPPPPPPPGGPDMAGPGMDGPGGRGPRDWMHGPGEGHGPDGSMAAAHWANWPRQRPTKSPPRPSPPSPRRPRRTCSA
jgi:Spy/CpxP family protein refolding chaperone